MTTLTSRLIKAGKELLSYQDTSPQTKLEQTRHYYPNGESTTQIQGVTRSDLGLLVVGEPMMRKGIWKENKDIFGEGWTIEHKDPDLEVDDDDLDLIKEFDKEAQTKYKMEQTGISANIYGDGFLELIFEEPKTVTSAQDIPTYAPVDLNVLKAEYIATTEERKGIEYYIYKETKKQYIHPNRICHVVKKRLPGQLFGISDVYTASRVMRSMMNADTYFGEAIEWASKGVFDLMLTGASQTELDKAEKNVKRRNVLIHDENATWTVHDIQTMSPKEYYDYFFIKIAATLDMPQHILTGVQPGQLTGSEIGLSDYYKNIINLQELIFTPVLERIYKLLLEGNGRSFEDYEIIWNPIYIDENAEAQILLARTNAASQALDRFVIDANEYRQIMKEGISNLAGESVLGVDIQPGPPMPEQPIEKTIPDETPVQEQLRIAREKRLGELEVLLQEKRLKDASKKK